MEVITRDRNKSLNPFFWDVIIQKSPGTTSYDPTMPRLYRWDSIRVLIKTACKTYVDDLRSVAAIQSFYKEAANQVDTTMGYLGL